MAVPGPLPEDRERLALRLIALSFFALAVWVSVNSAYDSAQTWLGTSLSAVLLLGLGFNAALGWWWADPVAGLTIAAVASREGIEAWWGENCCDTALPAASCSSTGDDCYP